jgi:retron-type reverse transcriptase
MYDCPARRRGQHVAGTSVRQVAADVHEGTPDDYLCRQKWEAIAAAQGDAATRKKFLTTLLSRTADTRNLRVAWNYLASHGGQAPGHDGLHYDDLDNRKIWALLRIVSKAILDDTYRPGPDRPVKIPKASGLGNRTLLLPSIVDRVVQRAIVQTIQPYLDPSFDKNSFGYRPGCDRQHALAQAEKLARSTNRWVWLTEDIRNAFDQVPQQRLLDIVRLQLPDEGIVRLIERVVLTDRRRGLRQGGSLSPLLLNLYLDHHLDRRWRKRYPDLPLLRVADDLLVLTHSEEEANQAWSHLETMLRPTGMPLKGLPSSAVHNLSIGHHSDWLGFHLSQGTDQLVIQLTEKIWNQLGYHLELTHTKPDSPLRAVEVVMGWVDQLGPCYSWSIPHEVHARVVSFMRELAFDELYFTEEELLLRWKKAWKRWMQIRSSCTKKERYATAPPVVMKPHRFHYRG